MSIKNAKGRDKTWWQSGMHEATWHGKAEPGAPSKGYSFSSSSLFSAYCPLKITYVAEVAVVASEKACCA